MKALIIASIVLLIGSVLIIGTHQILKSKQQSKNQHQTHYFIDDICYTYNNGHNMYSNKTPVYQGQKDVMDLDYRFRVQRWWLPDFPQLDAILTTDKPIYQPNDVVFANVELFHSLNKTSIYGKHRLDLRLTILDAQGTQKHVAYQDDCLVDATSVFTVNLGQIKELQNGGNFEIVIDQNPSSTYFVDCFKFPSARRTFRISKYSTETYQITMEMDNYGTKSSYAAGEKVTGYAKIYRSDGTTSTDFSSFKGSVFSSSLNINEDIGPKITFSKSGEGFFSFVIPTGLEINVATVYLKVTDSNTSGWEQTASGQISIVLQKDQIQMLLEPQSGLVITSSNLQQNFYFEFYNKKTNNAVDMKNIQVFEKCGDKMGYEIYNSSTLNQTPFPATVSDTFIKSISTSHRGKGKTMLKIKPKCIIVAKQYNDEVTINFQNTKPIREWIFKDFIKSDFIFQIQFPVIFNASYGKDLTERTSDGGNIDIDIFRDETIPVKKQYGGCPENQFTLVISNRQHSLYWTIFNFDQLKQSYNSSFRTLSIPASKLNLPTGGVLQVTIFKTLGSTLYDDKKQAPPTNHFYYQYIPISKFNYSGSRLIFLKPSNSLKVQINVDSLIHNPGDQKVKVQAKVTDQNNTPIVGGYVSLVVTDQSSIKEYKKYIPSTASRLYLQKDLLIRNTDGQLIESDEYVEHLWDQDIKDRPIFQIYPRPEESNLDLLLGIQPWRRGVFFLRPSYESTQAVSVQQKLNQLFGTKYFSQTVVEEDNVPVFEMARNEPAYDQESSKSSSTQQSSNSQSGKGIVENPQSEQEQTAIKFQTSVGNYMLVDPQNLRTWSHKRRQSWSESSPRVDQTQTLHFSSALKTNQDGEVQVVFDLSDLITKFSITAQAKSNAYHGIRRSSFSSNKPLQVTFDLPQSISTEDQLIVPISLQNNTPDDRTVSIITKINNLSQDTIKSNLSLGKNSNSKIFYTIPSSFKNLGTFDLNIKMKSGTTIYDSLTKKSSIKLKGLTKEHSFGGMIGNIINRVQFDKINIPNSFVPNSFSLTAKLLPKPVSNLNEALNSLIQDPYGCFEQTSSTNYPLVMAMSYFKTHSMPQDQKQAQREKDATEKLVKGYNKLVGFQVSQQNGGYQWFGKEPAHQALTAYGLLQFLEMKDVLGQAISSNMIERNQNYLTSRINSSTGKFELSTENLDTFGGAPQDLTIVYIVFALSQAARVNNDNTLLDKLQKSYQYILGLDTQNDPYMDALIANALINAKNNYSQSQIQTYLDRIITKQDATDGSITGAKTSITSSRGKNLIVETTSLAVIAWLRYEKQITSGSGYVEKAQKAIQFLISSVEKGGSYGNTQATILALKALILYDQSTGLINGSGKLVIKIKFADGTQTQINQVSFNEQAIDAIISKSTSSDFITAMGDINIIASIQQFTPKTSDNFKIPISIQLSYNDINLSFSQNKKIELSLTSSNASGTIDIEDSIQYSVSLKNNDLNNAIGMTLMILRYPSGLEISTTKLEYLRNNKQFDFYEVSLPSNDLTTHNQVIFYWKGLKKGETKVINGISFIAKWGGNFKPVQSEAYIYYDKEDSRITKKVNDLLIQTTSS